MNPMSLSTKPAGPDNALTTELLILPDGRILAHNLVQEMAAILSELSPGDESMRERARHASSREHDGSPITG
jgi:hypothetical protein